MGYLRGYLLIQKFMVTSFLVLLTPPPPEKKDKKGGLNSVIIAPLQSFISCQYSPVDNRMDFLAYFHAFWTILMMISVGNS